MQNVNSKPNGNLLLCIPPKTSWTSKLSQRYPSKRQLSIRTIWPKSFHGVTSRCKEFRRRNLGFWSEEQVRQTKARQWFESLSILLWLPATKKKEKTDTSKRLEIPGFSLWSFMKAPLKTGSKLVCTAAYVADIKTNCYCKYGIRWSRRYLSHMEHPVAVWSPL